MKEFLTRIDELLAQHPDQARWNLNQGLSEEQIAYFKTQITVELPETFYDLYRWHDGSSWDTENISILGNFTWQPMEELIEDHRFFLSDAEYMAQPCDPLWIPFLDNGCGDHYCLDPNGFHTGKPNQIILFCHDAGNYRIIEFASIEKMMETLLYVLEEEIQICIESKDYVDVLMVSKELHARINPGYPINVGVHPMHAPR
jgi:cell wall assembly regulator SMI1